ncbi:hypothetical protein HL667_00140 [Bradyrhizobium sp. 83012]|uniref:Integrase DNA-binding domain-containing protein n=1 Tax=Bradyrhizobium aeschynomenes TaxID=2734909 RepID=A0ABX2C533_9BRAD|nr:hypothetical protein [Bradyrhizobium aeschynomenes]NPU63404.1 hypothetical protein [Bradyrhizobium aeschynomenes]
MKDDSIRIIPHSPPGIPDTGSFEVRFADGRPSVYFYWDNNPGRRAISMSGVTSEEEARSAAQQLARSELKRLAP